MNRYVDLSGDIVLVVQPAPAAGAEASYTLPAAYRYELIACSISLVTSPAGGNRTVAVGVQSVGAFAWYTVAPVLQAGGLTYYYSFGQGMGAPASASPTDFAVGIPINNRCLAGWSVRTVSGGIGAADQYSALTLLLRRWLEAL